MKKLFKRKPLGGQLAGSFSSLSEEILGVVIMWEEEMRREKEKIGSIGDLGLLVLTFALAHCSFSTLSPQNLGGSISTCDLFNHHALALDDSKVHVRVKIAPGFANWSIGPHCHYAR